MRPERDALQASLDACMSKLSQARILNSTLHSVLT